MKFEINFTDEQMAKINELLEIGKLHPATGLTSIGAIVERIQERGLYDLSYRTSRNIREYQSYKEFKRVNK